MQHTNRASTFTGKVIALFGTRVFSTVAGVVNGILLARLLGPAGKGEYYILVLVPATAVVLLQFGLPRAFGFFAARGKTAGIMTKAFWLTAALSIAATVALTALLPFLRDEVLHGISPALLYLAFIGVPLAVHATFTSAIILGRQAVRWFSGVNIANSIATTVLLVVFLGVLGPSVNAAIAVYLITQLIQTIGFATAAERVTGDTGSEPVSYRQLFRYGLPFFPGSLAGFFSARVDAYLIAFLITDPAAQLGYYSMAVGLAEMVFFFPGAVSNLFFPLVASSPREESDRQVALVSRATILVTGAVALLLIPASAIMILLILPAFGPALPPLLVLLPAVVALSGTFVVSGYLSGIGKPGIVSTASLISLAVNVAANVILIPSYGIVGAAAASLVSYTLSSLVLTTVAARLTRSRMIDFWVPRVSDVRYLIVITTGLLRRVTGR